MALAILVAVLTPVVIKKIENGSVDSKEFYRQRKRLKVKDRKSKNISPKDIWEVENIRDGIVVLTGNRYRAVLKVNSVDFFLMSEPEQKAVEDALISLAMATNFSIQVFVTTSMIDTTAAIREIQKCFGTDIPDTMKEYAVRMVEYMDAMTLDRSMYIRSNYIVLALEAAKHFEQARGELYRRAGIVADGLRKARTTAELIKTDEVMDLLYRVQNRGHIFKPSQAVSVGALDFIKGGLEKNAEDSEA